MPPLLLDKDETENMAEDIEPFLAITAELLSFERMSEAAEVLKTSSARVEETGYDNWNGGTTIWTVYLLVDAEVYAQLGAKREILEKQINNRLGPLLERDTNDWYGVKISPKIDQNPDWRHATNEVPKRTRQNIFDGLKIDEVQWNGCLEEVEFLERLYELEKLPSYDPRFNDAAGDIWQHRVNNPGDWLDDWVYSDPRFDLLNCPSENFLRFICEIVHPVVRPDRNEALKLVHDFNDQLRPVGFYLVEEERIAGRPRFIASPLHATKDRSVSRARSVAEALDAGWMQKEIERLENAVEQDPALAIGTAKDLVETCCKSILTKRDVKFTRKTNLPDLTKLVAKELKLVPEGISDEAKGAETIRLILRNLSALTKYLAELRGLYGSGHGRDGQHRGLEPRHARLAVGAAVAFIDFVTDTYHQREEKNNKAKH